MTVLWGYWVIAVVLGLAQKKRGGESLRAKKEKGGLASALFVVGVATAGDADAHAIIFTTAGGGAGRVATARTVVAAAIPAATATLATGCATVVTAATTAALATVETAIAATVPAATFATATRGVATRTEAAAATATGAVVEGTTRAIATTATGAAGSAAAEVFLRHSRVGFQGATGKFSPIESLEGSLSILFIGIRDKAEATGATGFTI